MTIRDILRQLGLGEKEIQVYLSLLKHGKTTPAALARMTKINRATIYSIAKGLQTRGIITEDMSGKSLYFVALPPESLGQLIERPLRELKQKEGLVQKAIAELTLLVADKEYPVPRIRFVEESNLENFLYENIAIWQQSVLASDQVWWGTQDYTFLEEYGAFVDWYWAQPFSRSVKMYQVSNESRVEEEMLKKHPQPERDIRFSHDVDFTSSVWVGGEYLVMIVTKQHPFYLLEIHDATLSHNMREVFKKMWRES